MKKLTLLLFAAILMMSCTKEDNSPEKVITRSVEYIVEGYPISYSMVCEPLETPDLYEDVTVLETTVTSSEYVSMAVTCHGFGNYVITLKIDGDIVDYYEGRLYNNDVVFLSE